MTVTMGANTPHQRMTLLRDAAAAADVETMTTTQFWHIAARLGWAGTKKTAYNNLELAEALGIADWIKGDGGRGNTDGIIKFRKRPE